MLNVLLLCFGNIITRAGISFFVRMRLVYGFKANVIESKVNINGGIEFFLVL